MAGMPARRARREAGLISHWPAEAAAARGQVAAELSVLIENLLQSAKGAWYEEKVQDESGEWVRRVFQKSPNWRNCMYLVDRVMGMPRVEPNPTADRLDEARAGYLELQIAHDIIASQKKELEARGDKARIEVEMWPKQFVTEEEEASNIQSLAAEVNKALLAMTPEQFAEIITGRDPAAALEELKGRVGRDQAEIVAAVMKYKDTRVREAEEVFDEE